jgi:hypothetical protein
MLVTVELDCEGIGDVSAVAIPLLRGYVRTQTPMEHQNTKELTNVGARGGEKMERTTL